KVFIYCLMKASHCHRKQLEGKQFVELEKGQFVFGRKKAAVELNMKESTVRDYINLIQQDEVIQVNSTNKYSNISIGNWEVYQHTEDDDRQQNDNRMTAEGQQNDTNKNVKNVKNDKKSTSRSKLKFETTHMDLAEHFYNQILKNNPGHKKPNLKMWANEIRLMIERDNRTEEQIKYLMEWVQNDDFEMTNVLSPSKLRKRFDQLVMKVKNEKGKASPKK